MPRISRLRVPVAAALLAVALLAGSLPGARAVTVGLDGLPVTNAAGVRFGVQAHRGGGNQWPQNSVEAYANAAASGYDAIETDILYTSDGVAVMNHSDELNERCTHTGEQIHLMTFAQVQDVRCEDLDGNLTVPLATFDELVTVLTSYPDVWLSLDLKGYPGQTDASRRAYAAQDMKLLKASGLMPRTRIISFLWEQHLPVVRKFSRSIFFYAYDVHHMDLDRVRLAAKLKASAYGIKLKYTTFSLVTYVKKLGMESTPYDVYTAEDMAFSIATGGRYQLFSTNTPAQVQSDLTSGVIDLNPVGRSVTTVLAAPVPVLARSLRAQRNYYPVLLGPVVGDDDLPALRSVTLQLAVSGGKGKGSITVAGCDYPPESAVKKSIPKGARVIVVKVPVGEDGAVRITATKTVRITVTATAFTRERYTTD